MYQAVKSIFFVEINEYFDFRCTLLKVIDKFSKMTRVLSTDHQFC